MPQQLLMHLKPRLEGQVALIRSQSPCFDDDCRGSRVRVTSDVIYPGAVNAQIISADIGEPEAPPRERRTQHVLAHLALTPQEHNHSQDTRLRSKPQSLKSLPPFQEPAQPQLSIAELKSTLRRLSKIVLAGYGGASLLFFGISPDAISAASSSKASVLAQTAAEEEVQLTHAVDASEAEAAGQGILPNDATDTNDASGTASGKDKNRASYAWWDILLGKHDQEILERSIALLDENHDNGREKTSERDKIQAKMQEKMEATAVSLIMFNKFGELKNEGRWKRAFDATLLGAH